jgi:hypothetical protein
VNLISLFLIEMDFIVQVARDELPCEKRRFNHRTGWAKKKKKKGKEMEGTFTMSTSRIALITLPGQFDLPGTNPEGGRGWLVDSGPLIVCGPTRRLEESIPTKSFTRPEKSKGL